MPSLVFQRLPVPEDLVYPSISLLTTRSYVLLGFTVNGICPILCIYHLDSPSTLLLDSRPPRSSSLHLPPIPKRSLLATEIHSRLFPALHRDALAQPIMLLDIRPDPPSSNTPFVFGGVEKRRRPHTTNPSRGVLEFDLLAGNRLFYVHLMRDELVGIVEGYERRAKVGLENSGGMRREVRLERRPKQWAEWGEKGCRMFEAANPVQRSWVSASNSCLFDSSIRTRGSKPDLLRSSRRVRFAFRSRSPSSRAIEPFPIVPPVQLPPTKTSF